MNLAIGRLHTRVSLPRRLHAVTPSVERLARDAVVQSAPAALASALPAGPAVWRIRRVNLTVQVSPRDLQGSALPERWREEFRRAVAAVVSRGSAADVVSAGSRARWSAGFLVQRLEGLPVESWAYEEFASLTSSDIATAFEAVLATAPGEAADVLMALDEAGVLDRVLNGCDDAACARICGVLDRDRPTSTATVDVATAISVGQMVLRHPSPGGLLSHARAIQLFAQQFKESRAIGAAPLPPRTILAGQRVLDALCGLDRAAGLDPVARGAAGIPDHLREKDPALWNLVMAVWPGGAEPGGPTSAQSALIDLIAQLRGHVPTAGIEVARHVTSQWIATRYAGILLLAPIVQALGWPHRIRTSEAWTEHGERAFTYLLAGIAASLTGRRATRDDPDPAIAILAGCLGDFQIAGLRHFAEHAADSLAANLQRVLLDEADSATPNVTWEALCARLGEYLVRRFAERLRGFRHSSHRFVVTRFLALPGRILVEPERILVALDANPLWVAVHLSGADAPVGELTWIPGRRLEFELGGL